MLAMDWIYLEDLLFNKFGKLFGHVKTRHEKHPEYEVYLNCLFLTTTPSTRAAVRNIVTI